MNSLRLRPQFDPRCHRTNQLIAALEAAHTIHLSSRNVPFAHERTVEQLQVRGLCLGRD